VRGDFPHLWQHTGGHCILLLERCPWKAGRVNMLAFADLCQCLQRLQSGAGWTGSTPSATPAGSPSSTMGSTASPRRSRPPPRLPCHPWPRSCTSRPPPPSWSSQPCPPSRAQSRSSSPWRASSPPCPATSTPSWSTRPQQCASRRPTAVPSAARLCSQSLARGLCCESPHGAHEGCAARHTPGDTRFPQSFDVLLLVSVQIFSATWRVPLLEQTLGIKLRAGWRGWLSFL